MRALTRKLFWLVHRALCGMGIHAIEKVFMFDDESDNFKEDGAFCGVCTRTWEEKQC